MAEDRVHWMRLMQDDVRTMGAYCGFCHLSVLHTSGYRSNVVHVATVLIDMAMTAMNFIRKHRDFNGLMTYYRCDAYQLNRLAEDI